MVRTPYDDKDGIRRGAWSEEEDNKLKAYVLRYGHWNWRQLPKFAGLARCGKSCRLRWVNYLKPGLERGKFSREEEELVIRLHNELGSKWSEIAARLPGRTDNQIKNFWNTHIKKGIKENSSGKEQIAQTNNENNESGGEQDEKSSEFNENHVPWKEDLTRESPMAVDPPLQNSEASPPAPENPSTESPSSCSISPRLGGMEIPEDSLTASESFLLPPDSFWNEPFLVDTLSSEGNNSLELSAEFMYPYTSYNGEITGDAMDILDQFM